MAQKRRHRSGQRTGGRPHPTRLDTAGVRIIGGQFRGRKLEYAGDLRVRPMKDRTREAVFNLVGPAVRGKHAIDLFAGTGVLALEALSRGASRATLIEQHFPTAAVVRRNVAALEAEDRCQVISGSVFAWWKRRPDMAIEPWLVFCSPPYAFFVERREQMLEILGQLLAAGPEESVFVVESDERFVFAELPDPEGWDVREYPPARVGIYFKSAGGVPPPS